MKRSTARVRLRVLGSALAHLPSSGWLAHDAWAGGGSEAPATIKESESARGRAKDEGINLRRIVHRLGKRLSP
ncbi:MAG: hypothetical protein ACK56F_25900 [bacterium]